MPERNPVTWKAHSRQVLWQITVPLVLGVIVVLALAVLVTMLGEAEASLWADISIIFLLIPLMVISLLFLALTAGLAYLVFRLLKVIPPYARKAQSFVFRFEQRVRSGANAAAKPILRVESFNASVRALRRRIARMMGP